MKTSLWYVLRDIRRRPRQFLSLTAVSAAVMTVLILLILWLNAQWRASVMPETEYNTHFHFYNLTEAEKEAIRHMDFVQCTYDTYYLETPAEYENCFKVRITEEHWMDANSCARQILQKFDLYHHVPYKTQYEREYNRLYKIYEERWLGLTEKNGMTIQEAATLGARNLILFNVQNKSYIQKTQNSYLIQPSFIALLVMFVAFLSGATTILTLETYRTKFCDFGTLRALGFTRRGIFYINWLFSVAVTLGSIPASILFSYGAVQIYYLLVRPYSDVPNVYMTIDSFIPVGTLVVLAVLMLLAALIGTTIVCLIYRTKSTLSLLRREGTFTVPFVSKTSPAFEEAEGIQAYNPLYTRRARKMLIRYAIVVAILMPLPLYYINIVTTQYSYNDASVDAF